MYMCSSSCQFNLSRQMLSYVRSFFFFNDTATTEIYTLSLHDALPISGDQEPDRAAPRRRAPAEGRAERPRSEEHTSELQSLAYLVCRLLLEKKKKIETDNIEHRSCYSCGSHPAGSPRTDDSTL